MNKEQTKKCIEVMQAFVDGREVGCGNSISINPSWDWKNWAYKVKPEPFECWVNVYPDGYGVFAYQNIVDASGKFSSDIDGGRCAVHMKEVE